MLSGSLGCLIGKPAPEFYTSVVSFSTAISGIAIAEYSPPPPIQERSRLSAVEKRLADLAGEARRNGRASYLEILLEMATNVDHPVDGIVSAVLYHQPHPAQRTWLSRQDVLSGALIEACRNASATVPLAFMSRVRTENGSDLHVPLLDFHVEKSARSLAVVALMAEKLLDDRYVILETERSYHVAGMDLVDDREIRCFLSSAVLLSPITDHAYIAHQLIEGECALRMTGRGEERDVPTVIKIGDTVAREPFPG